MSRLEKLWFNNLPATEKSSFSDTIEFKENLFQQSDIPSTLSDKKFQQNQIENLNNVFYFKRENIENSKIIISFFISS